MPKNRQQSEYRENWYSSTITPWRLFLLLSLCIHCKMKRDIFYSGWTAHYISPYFTLLPDVQLSCSRNWAADHHSLREMWYLARLSKCEKTHKNISRFYKTIYLNLWTLNTSSSKDMHNMKNEIWSLQLFCLMTFFHLMINFFQSFAVHWR